MRLVALICAAFLCVSCATRPHTYTAPDDRKVKAAQSDLTVKVTRVRETAKKAQIATEEAKAHADLLPTFAANTADKLQEAREKLPAEYRPLLDALETAVAEQAKAGEAVKERVSNAVGWNTQLQGQVNEAEQSRVNLQNEQDSYAVAASSLAQSATEERNYRIAAERENASNRWFGWLWKLGAFLLIGVVGLFFLLKWLGKLGWAAGKIGLKATL